MTEITIPAECYLAPGCPDGGSCPTCKLLCAVCDLACKLAGCASDSEE